MASAKDKKQEESAVVHTAEIVKEETAGELALSEFDYGDDFGSGFENIGKDDLKTPFIKQLQALSPEVVEGTIEGARPGMFVNTATGELFPMETGLIVVPIAKTVRFIEWKQRKNGGGFVNMHEPTSEVVAKTIALNGKKFGKLLLNPKDENSTELIETHDMFVMLLDKTGTIPTGDAAVFSFTSTKIKAIKTWVTKMWSVKPDNNVQVAPGKQRRFPFHSFRSRISGFKDPNTSKGTFFNVKVEPFMPNPALALKLKSEWKATLIQRKSEARLYETALGFADMFKEGSIKADYESQTNAGGEATGDEDVPF